MEDNELYAVFNPDFIKEIETLGNTVVVSKYYMEDVRTTGIDSLEDVLLDKNPYQYNIDGSDLYGLWDDLRNSLKVHLSLPSQLLSNEVRESESGDPDNFEFDSKYSGINNGNRLVRAIRFTYFEKENSEKTAFILTGDLGYNSQGKLIVEPIRCNQNKILINVNFPDTTKANISAKYIENDTKFLEGYGIMRGDNIFFTSSYNNISSRLSSLEYLNYTTTETRITKKETPYVANDGACIVRRNTFRIYTSIKIYTSNLLTNILPNTRASLNKKGGNIRIYGTLNYLDYEVRGSEITYIGTGTESIDGIPDVSLIITEHDGGLMDVKISDRFYISYGVYEGQSDPSVLVKARVYFYNPFKKEVEYINSKNILLTQEESVIPQWEIIYRSTGYSEPNNVPVYLFPWESGYEHSFIIRTTLPSLRISDFYMEYEDPILLDYFDYTIERIENINYPLTDYKVILRSRTDNLESIKWFPIVNGVSDVKLATLILKEYEYSESFYFVQCPNVSGIELHNSNNINISEINLDYNQTKTTYYPVALGAHELSDVGERNAWKLLRYDSQLIIPDQTSGLINPDNANYLENSIVLNIPTAPQTIDDVDLGNIVVGRIRESEQRDRFARSDWRNVVLLSTVSIPVKKRGIPGKVTSDESIVLKEINLYRIKVVSNGPFACWMRPSDDYCFFDSMTDTMTGTNYYYSQDFDNTDGIYVYLALHDTRILNEEPVEENQIFFTVTRSEPEWGDDMPECFSNSENLSTCSIIRQAPEDIEVSYVDQKDAYVFLGPFSEGEVRFRSSETPIITMINLENSGINQQFESYSPYAYNPITLVDKAIPEFTTEENYKYHTQYLQNPNDLHDYYPVSPSYLYRAESYNYQDINKSFFIFKKALGPSFYRSDSSTSNTVFMVNNPTSNDTNNRNIIIRSRYEIPDSEFVKDLAVYNGFNIGSIVHTVLDSSDYRHQYNIILNTSLSNSGSQRLLGTLIITSRIYGLVNFTSREIVDMPPYIEFTRDEIDKIVQPAVMKISIIQEAGSNFNSDIEVKGNRAQTILTIGERRRFTIVSDYFLDDPIFTSITNCRIMDRSEEGFTLVVPSRLEGYVPLVLSETTDYTTYTRYKQTLPVTFNLSISPSDPDGLQNLPPYTESFNFRQDGINAGFIYASSSINKPKLYIGQNTVTENVSSSTTIFPIFLGAFRIPDDGINEDLKGTLEGVQIRTTGIGNNYNTVGGDIIYRATEWSPTINLKFPENKGDMAVDRVFTITYNDGNTTHQLVITIKQESAIGTVVCSNNAYFLSHGECIETDDYSENIGLFTFDTDLDINTLSLSIPQNLLDSYYFLRTGQSSSVGSSYKRYKAYIKLKPNLSSSTIEGPIFSFIKNGKVIRNVYINQGYYCLRLCRPGSTQDGIINGGTIGSYQSPIEVPTQNNTFYGLRKVFKLVLKRSEPIPSMGEFTRETIDLLDSGENGSIEFPTIKEYTWSLVNNNDSDKAIGYSDSQEQQEESENSGESNRGSQQNNQPGQSSSTYLRAYSVKLYKDDINIESQFYPFLENIYTVYPEYYGSDFIIRVNFSIIVKYPVLDPLSWVNSTTEHTYNIYLNKKADMEAG